MPKVATFLIQGTQIITIRLDAKGLRFKCRRCATFCCRLGGPVATRKDLVRLRGAVCRIENLVETMTVGTRRVRALASNPAGQCIILRRTNRSSYRCSTYGRRPDICRMYPFRLVRRGSRLNLHVLPCRGLNYRRGELVDKKFVKKLLRTTTVA